MKKSRYVCVKMSPIGHKWSAKLKNVGFVGDQIFFLFRNFTKKVVSKFSYSLFFSNSKSISTKQTLLGFPTLFIYYSFGFNQNRTPQTTNEPKQGRLHSKNKNDKLPTSPERGVGEKLIVSCFSISIFFIRVFAIIPWHCRVPIDKKKH